MQQKRKRPIDILCAGELLVDMISRDFADSLEAVRNFERMPGGSPANLCMNMARLGNTATLVASVGNDDLGTYLKSFVEKNGVDCTNVDQVEQPTTLILVTRTRSVANFEAYRGADNQIASTQFPKICLAGSSIFHTTCFALSKRPAQRTILQSARKAFVHGAQLSLDANYAQKLWPDRLEAQEVVAKFCALEALVKVSDVDWERLYEGPMESPEAAARHFLGLGARAVCVTLGEKGCLTASAEEMHFLPARKIEVKDTTGAGDAFWSGFLTAWLDGKALAACAKAGRSMAEMKLQTFGQLPPKVDRKLIYKDL